MTIGSPAVTPAIGQRGSAGEVFLVFLRLGLTSFGGPIAHIGYFHDEFVMRRRWLDEKTYSDIVALCQLLPGPASSQVGITIGLSRAGYAGAIAAWLGFTMPSAVALVLFAYGVAAVGSTLGAGWLHGLKIAAVAVVAQAVLSMMRSLTPDRERATFAVAAAVLVLAVPSAWGQVAAIVGGGILASAADRDPVTTPRKCRRHFRKSKLICEQISTRSTYLNSRRWFERAELVEPAPIEDDAADGR